MKNLFIFVFLLSLCACAGNPPAWWNPSGTYGADPLPTRQTVRNTQPSLSSTVTAEEEEPMEQTFDPAYDAYEEMRLTPLPETSGEEKADAQPTDVANENAEELDLGHKPAPSAKVAEKLSESPLPSDGSLPPPSVLE